jgi:hypothetical protein
MSLRRQSLSPTANLLRNSRLFSLPNPLPRPLVTEPYGSGSVKASDSATLPYPTHQAIATTPSSLARGDWGLKRPLPSKSRLLQSSSPVVRVNQWDTIEHVTDFDSAADHVRTRQKFEELGIPMIKGLAVFGTTDVTSRPGKSAFEETADITAYTTEVGMDGAAMYLSALKEKVRSSVAGQRQEPDTYVPPKVLEHAVRRTNQRWKHDGPWLPGMSARDFTSYLSKTLTSRRAEFNKYLIEYVKNQIYDSRRQAHKASNPPPLDDAEAKALEAELDKKWSIFTPWDIAAGIHNLRTQCAQDPLNSKLVQNLIVPFLRLPPIKLKATHYSADQTGEVGGYKFDDDTTPNSTHPSAGLSYLRTKAYLANHPILGPQAKDAPVEARVIQSSATARVSNSPYAALGVAGFVANDEVRKTGGFQRTGAHLSGVEKLDLDTHGGAKVSVQAPFAAVSPDGKVHIKLLRSYGEELRVKRGELEDRPPEREGAEQNAAEDLTFNNTGEGKTPEERDMLDMLTQANRENAKKS